MSRIDDLIAEHCPHGVEFEPLGQLVRIRNGKDHKPLGAGDIPAFGTGGVMRYVDTAAYDKPSVLIPRKGSLNKLYYVDEPFWTVDTIFYTEIGPRIEPKFLYYYLAKLRLETLNEAGGVPSLTQTVLNAIRIPVPPMEVQREIVRILDTFSALEAELEVELEAELEARRKQYEHYRSQLLTFNSDEVAIEPLGELVTNFDSQRRPVTRSSRVAGEFPYYGANGVQDYVDDYLFNGEFLLIGEDGSVTNKDGSPVLNWATGKIWVNNHAHVLQSKSSRIRLRYLYHYLATTDISAFVTGKTQPKLNQRNMNRIPIAVPPVAEQERIVDLLDKFDALVNDLSVGLPAELAARRTQYEHYRDRLLTFEERV